MTIVDQLRAPVSTFRSRGGREFSVKDGEHDERWDGDPLWSDSWAIVYDGRLAGKLFRNLNYGTGPTGAPRWQASTRELFWSKAADAPTGIGCDVAAFDTAEQALAEWARSADEILDWAAGKPVPSIYAKTGVFRKNATERRTCRLEQNEQKRAANKNRKRTRFATLDGYVVGPKGKR